MDKSELRMDPLTREWTIFNDNRALPPSCLAAAAGELEPTPFRAGLERFAPHTLFYAQGAEGWQVRVVPNRAPVLGLEANPAVITEGVYSHLGGFGAHEIVVEDPSDRRFSDLSAGDVAKVVEAWRARIADLVRDGRMTSFTVVKNEGRAAGQTVAHSISQVVAMGIVAPALRRKLDAAKEYFAAHEQSLFAEVLAVELKGRERVVYENAGFVVFCPYAARTPFEMAIWPKRHGADFYRITADEVGQLGDALHCAIAKLNGALAGPAYHLVLTTAPSRSAQTEEWPGMDAEFCWHVNVLPRVHPISGIEISTGCYVNGVWPEVAADFLRRKEMQP